MTNDTSIPVPSPSSRLAAAYAPEDLLNLREDLAGLVRRTLANADPEVETRIKTLSGRWSTLTPLPKRPAEDAQFSYPVRVIPYEGQWCVACGKGHYAWPLEKALATKQACELAMQMGCSNFAVCDENDHVLEVLSAIAS